MVNQICIAGVVQGLAEGLHFAQCAGLDPAVVIESISKGAAQSWQMENRWQTMVNDEFEFGFAVDWMRKDLGIALDEASQNGARLELTELVDGFYARCRPWAAIAGIRRSLSLASKNRVTGTSAHRILVKSLRSQGWPLA